MDDPEYDTELMLRLRAGEDAALNELMSRWERPLAQFIYRYVGNQAEAVDLAQETFVRVYEYRHRYRPKGKFSTWLFTIAANLSRNLIRWRSRHPTVPLDSPDDTPGWSDTLAARGDTPPEAAERAELAAALSREVQALPHDLRTAILLFEYQDMSHEEIAKVLGCTPKAVETRLYRARKLLRERLAALRVR